MSKIKKEIIKKNEEMLRKAFTKAWNEKELRKILTQSGITTVWEQNKFLKEFRAELPDKVRAELINRVKTRVSFRKKPMRP